MRLSSPAIDADGRIPARYTCDGANVSPPLRWGDVPDQTRAFALLVSDPDAGDFIHWLLPHIPGDATELPENVGDAVADPAYNDFGTLGWGGPCPRAGIHQYLFTLHALPEPIRLPEDATASQLRMLLGQRSLAAAELRATYRHERVVVG